MGTRTDAWIFLAIARAAQDGAAPLDAVLSCADHINVAIPTREELEQSVGRLSAANWVSVEGNRFALLPNGRRVFDQVDSQDAFPRNQPEIVERLLNILRPLPRVRAVWHLSDKDFHAAVDQHNRTMKAAWKGLTKT